MTTAIRLFSLTPLCSFEAVLVSGRYEGVGGAYLFQLGFLARLARKRQRARRAWRPGSPPPPPPVARQQTAQEASGCGT